MAYKSLSQAAMVKRGYGQVEPNNLSARFTGGLHAQLPAAQDIEVLEQGQFVKYDYANKVCNFTGKGEWMLVYNEVKLYRDWEVEEDFAMVKRDYNGYVYSPVGQNYENEADIAKTFGEEKFPVDPDRQHLPIGMQYQRENLTVPEMMPEGTQMVPRVWKTQEGDLFTTNTIAAAFDSVNVGDLLKPNAKGILAPGASMEADNFVWQIVKKYSLPDLQPAVKVMRVK